MPSLHAELRLGCEAGVVVFYCFVVVVVVAVETLSIASSQF